MIYVYRLGIPLNADTHQNEIHDCKIDHRCGSQCPECRSFCQLPHGHTDPYHSTNTHRVKKKITQGYQI
jgi:hypothetical protein